MNGLHSWRSVSAYGALLAVFVFFGAIILGAFGTATRATPGELRITIGDPLPITVEHIDNAPIIDAVPVNRSSLATTGCRP